MRLSCLVSATASAEGRATDRPIESWADPGLKVTRGLLLWLDAGRLNAARKAFGRSELSDGAKVGVWYDGSGNGRHFAQLREQAQPVYQDGALRFDGDTSYLERAGAGMRLEDFTIFIVAAPFSNAGDFRAFLATHEQGQPDFVSGVTIDHGTRLHRKIRHAATSKVRALAACST